MQKEERCPVARRLISVLVVDVSSVNPTMLILVRSVSDYTVSVSVVAYMLSYSLFPFLL